MLTGSHLGTFDPFFLSILLKMMRLNSGVDLVR